MILQKSLHRFRFRWAIPFGTFTQFASEQRLKHANSVLPKAISSLYQGYFPYEDARGLLVEIYPLSRISKKFPLLS